MRLFKISRLFGYLEKNVAFIGGEWWHFETISMTSVNIFEEVDCSYLNLFAWYDMKMEII